MKAFVYHNYLSPDDVLGLQDIDEPVVKDKEVLV
jgi:NADPH:quinone reductase-like Zn-dependent oxidoreductase